MKIKRRGTTSNLDRFVMVLGNREYNPAHAKDLAEKIKAHNMLDLYPLVCEDGHSGMLNVIDGQHRLGAAKILKIPVPYVVVFHGTLTADDIRSLNSGQSGWVTKDFLHHFKSLRVADYERLTKFCEETKLPLMTSAMLLSEESTTSGAATKTFRDGKFKISNETKARLVAEIVGKLKAAGAVFTAGRGCVLAIARIIDTGRLDMDVLERGIERIAGMIHPCGTWQQFAKLFSDAYDYRRPINQRADLYEAVMQMERIKSSEYNMKRRKPS